MENILVIRIGRAGDMVMITPALQALLGNYPEYKIHVLTSRDGKRVLSGFNPRITNIYVLEKKRMSTIIKRLKQFHGLKKIRYEYIFNFELKPAYKKIYKKSRGKVYELDRDESHLNYAKRCLNVVQRSLEKQIPNYWNWLPVTDEGMENARKQLSEVGIGDSDYIIGIHPSFSGSKSGLFRRKRRNQLREWPPEYFSDVINILTKYSDDNSLNVKIIIDLLPDEKEIGERILRNCHNRISLFTNKPDFQRYKALIKRMNLLITPDTGPMHIAAAMGTKIVCMFSGKSPADCGPYMPAKDYIALRAEDYDLETGLQAIKPEHVFEACKRFLPG